MALLALTASACGEGTDKTGGGVVRVVTTTAILADFVERIGGELVEARTLVPPGADVHSFRTTPQDSIDISKASLVVSNGLGLDDSLDPVINSALGDQVAHLVVGPRLDAGAGEGDPHLWQDPLKAVDYVLLIGDALARVDSSHGETYRENAAAYVQRLRELDREIAALLDQVPAERRHLVTFHDAFGHFARRYGWTVSAIVSGDASDVTPGAIVRVMESIRDLGIPAVFAEPQLGAGTLRQAASDTGVKVGVIYSDTLDDTVPTYIEMMRFNARSLVENLR